MNFQLKVLLKRFKTFHDRTADVTYCADVTLFMHATSGGLSLNAAFFFFFFFFFFFCSDFLLFVAFCCFKCYLVSFSRCKTAFSANTIPPKHA